jgi:hypothetical protein
MPDYQTLRRLTAAMATVLTTASILIGVDTAPATATPEDFCAGQQAAWEATRQRITAHNAKPHVFNQNQAAQAAAYNAEATKLERAQTSARQALLDCVEAIAALEDAAGGESEIRLPTPDKRKAIDAATKSIPSTWQPSPAPAPQLGWRVPRNSPVRSLYDVLRKENPGELGNVRLQGRPRPEVDDPDPAYPGLKIGTRADGASAATPDHIIPVAEIINMKGFTKLNPDSMYAVTRAPLNYQWLSFKSNWAKSSRSVAAVNGVDPAWQADQVQLEQTTRKQLEALIQKLLKSQG